MAHEYQYPRGATRIVTPEQLADGYLELCGTVAYPRRYHVIRELPDGNYVVLNPDHDKPSRE